MARRKGPQAKQAYSYIKSKILSFELPPGASVSDHALAQELDMSRSPVREAIFMLTSDGLIVSTGTGAQVAPMTLRDIVEICQVRKAVEVAAIEILLDNGGMSPSQKNKLTDIYKKLQSTTDAMQNYRYDDLFHGEIMEMASNSRLSDISNRMRLQIYRARWLTFVMPERMEEARQEHEAIYQALMDNGAKPSTIIMDPHTMTRGQFEEFVARLRGDHAGENNAGKAMVLDGGKTVAAAGFNARDMDYATGVTTSGREIAIALGVPPELVGDSANKTYANAAEANKEFALHTGALSAKVCPVYGVARIGFDASQIDGMRGDEAAMMSALQASTFLTVNEKRQRLGFEPVPNGDVILTGMGNVPLDEVATVPGMDTDQGDPLVRLLYSENGDPLQVLADKKPKVRDDDPLQSLL